MLTTIESAHMCAAIGALVFHIGQRVDAVWYAGAKTTGSGYAHDEKSYVLTYRVFARDCSQYFSSTVGAYHSFRRFSKLRSLNYGGRVYWC